MAGMSVILLAVVCAIITLVVLVPIALAALVKLGVLVRYAAKPPRRDTGRYTLSQGREVRPEEERERYES
jgi:hypothetical protein